MTAATIPWTTRAAGWAAGAAPMAALHLQGSLLDGFPDEGGEIALGPLGGSVRRAALSAGAWVDHRPGWLAGADALFESLLTAVPWHAERRPMYDRVVDVPRLLSYYDAGAPLPHPVLAEARSALDAHYRPELGEPFVTAGLCLYRDGRDSVAWHGDTLGRGRTEDTMVAILSVGAPRPFLLRPRRSGGSGRGRAQPASSRAGQTLPASSRAGQTLPPSPILRYELGHGDLLVMGGSCQRAWEHAVPKSARVAGPRISIQFRPREVR